MAKDDCTSKVKVFKDILGKTINKITMTKDSSIGGGLVSDEILFETDDGKKYRMYHSQNCFEDVHIDEIVSNLSDIIGDELLIAESVSQEASDCEKCNDESCSWTFYRFGTFNGSVTIRWFGSSNGCYSEEVEFEEI